MKSLLTYLTESYFNIDDYVNNDKTPTYKTIDEAVKALEKAVNEKKHGIYELTNMSFLKSIKITDETIGTDKKSLMAFNKELLKCNWDAMKMPIFYNEDGAAYAIVMDGLLVDIRNGWNNPHCITKNPGGYHTNVHDISYMDKEKILNGYTGQICICVYDE